MPGTILLDDYRDMVGNQLQDFARNLNILQDRPSPQPQAAPVAQQPVLNEQSVAQQLQSHVDNVLQTGQQVAGAVQQAPQQVQQILQDHVDSILNVQPPPTPPAPVTPAGGEVAGAPQQPAEVTAPEHAPSPPLQTAGTQIANTPGAGGQVFPLAVKPDNAPTATYHSQGGSDLMAPRGTPVLNMQNGRVDEVFTDNGSHTVGGNAVLIHGDDGLDYYYAHFDQPTALKPGQRVEAGEQIGAVGNSGNAYKGGQGATHLHIGIGHGISNGVGSEGGLGQDFNAQRLLTDLQSGVGQATAAARGAVQTATTAGLSGGGELAGRIGDRGQQILGGAGQIADWLGDQGQKVVQAVLVTEGGLSGARGDQGKSAGPLQFYEQGQLATFARQHGLDLASAKDYVEQHPLEAVQWAIGTASSPGYLAQAILRGQAQGLSGADLATYVQRTGQVSVSPERAGANYNALFSGGQGPTNPNEPVTAPLRTPLVVGDQTAPQARQPIYASTMQPGDEQPAGFLRQPLNILQDTAGRVAGAVGGVASDIGSGARAVQRDVEQAAPIAGQALEDFARNGPIGATRAGLQAAVDPETRRRAAQALTELAGQASTTQGATGIGAVAGALGIGPYASGDLLQTGLSVAAGLIGQPSALDAIQTAQQLTTKYPLDANGVLPNIDAMTPEDRQKFLEAMMVLGTTSNPIEGRAPRPGEVLGRPALRPGEVAPARPGEVGRPAEVTPVRPVAAAEVTPTGEAARLRAPEGAPVVEAGVARAPEAVPELPQTRVTRAAETAPITPEAAPVERYHYTPNGDFDQFRTGERGVVYLAETPMQALSGAQAGYRENVRRSAGIPTALREESGRLLRVNAADDLRVFQDDWPSHMTAAEHDAALERFDTAKQGQPADVQQAVDRLRSLSLGRAGAIEGDTIRYNAPPSVLSHPAAEAPAMQQALRALGYDAAKVGDEAGTSLAVLDPSKLNITGRAPAQANVGFATRLGGAAVGGVAGNIATPEGASPQERARNIALGAGAGFVGGGALARAVERGGFRAPTTREVGAFVRGTSGEGPVNPAELVFPPERVPPERAPRSLGEVQTNRWALREPQPGERAMTDDELASYYDTLDQRLQQVQARHDAVDELLRNPGQKIERPPWAAGFTSDQVAEMARKVDRSPFEPLWWEKAGLEAGSGEVREMTRESGIERGAAQRELMPAELRRERNDLARERRDILTTGDQLINGRPGQRFVRAVPDQATPELPFDAGARSGPTDIPQPEATGPRGAGGGRDADAIQAQEIVTNNYRLRSTPAEVVGEQGGVVGRGIVAPELVVREAPSAETKRLMPNLDALLGEDMPEVKAQIQKAVEDNPELFAAYQQGTISWDSLKNDLALRVGMDKKSWMRTKVGQAFNEREQVALQAAAVQSQIEQTALARDILARGGVDALSPEELAYSLSSLIDAQRLLAVARGGRSTAGRSLNALKIRIDAEMAGRVTASNERRAAQRTAEQARRGTKRATELLQKTRELDTERQSVGARGRDEDAPRNILQQIDQAYADLDRYNAMSLHEKAAEFDRLKAERDKRAAARRSKVREAPEELLKALQDELKWEQTNFAKRKDTWETMAFWDSKAAENAAAKRAGFRGGLYIEQQRRLAQQALKESTTTEQQAFDAEMRRRTNQRDKAQRLLESIGGEKVTKDLLQSFVDAINDPDPAVAAKFLKGTTNMSAWGRATVVRLGGLLSAPITHMVNMGGNLSSAVIEVPTRALTVGIDAMRAGLTGGERQAYRAELLPMLQAYGPGFLAALPDALRALRTGITPAEMADLSKVRRGQFSPSEPLNAVVEAPLRALQAEDILFRNAAFSAHSMRVATREAVREGFTGAQVNGRAATILKNLEDYPELAQEASDAAARQVFQERRTVPGLGAVPEQSEAARFATSQVMPFVRTPANITAQGAAMSPLGAIGTAQAVTRARGMPMTTAAERTARGREVLLAEERAARTVIGTGLLGVAVLMGSSGLLTGDYPSDQSLRDTLPQGWRPWSFRINDPITGNTYYVPFQNLSMAGMPFAMAAILTDPMHRGKTVLSPDEQVGAATAIGRYVIDNTFLQGVSDFVDMLHDPKTSATKFAEPLAASYGPYSSLGRELQRVTGVASRNPREGFIGLLDALEANYPGLSAGVPEATTPIGEPRTQGATGAGRYVPFRYDIERDEPTLKTLRENDVGLPNAPKQLNVVNGHIDLSEAEQDQLKRARGEAIRDVVARVSSTPQFQRADGGLRNQMLKENLNFATRRANDQFLKDLGNDAIRARRQARAAPEPYYLGGVAAAS
jgi:murein DD-endopeptidase MepM/ murein hydrolase activator NlpD